ncbi:TetR/AcrR family transcriptional regulator [Nocardioides sp.]|uniref:TetR/AcrR family transcriptional regulator n=1 Tax=Nocardioides sp. TaxID=35761 RepID=UPI0031FE6566
MNFAVPPPTSAKGQRLTPKGLETRRQMLEVALSLLATGDSDAVSANLVAKSAGVSWGTVQHQFGDADGLWAAVMEHIRMSSGPVVWAVGKSPTVEGRVKEVVDLLWKAFDSPYAAASITLRTNLPRELDEFRKAFPLTAAEFMTLDAHWAREFTRFFDGLKVDKKRAARVCALLPGALRGLHSEQVMSMHTNIADARRGLTESITLYLTTK